MDILQQLRKNGALSLRTFLQFFPKGFNDSVVGKDKRLSLMGIFFTLRERV